MTTPTPEELVELAEPHSEQSRRTASHRKAATMSDDRVELKPCPTPWCEQKGGEPYVFERRRDCLGVYCPSCGVSTGYFPNEAAAIEQWNTRTLDPSIESLQAEVERYRTLLEKAAPFVGWASTRSQVVAGVHADELCDEIDQALAAKGEMREHEEKM